MNATKRRCTLSVVDIGNAELLHEVMCLLQGHVVSGVDTVFVFGRALGDFEGDANITGLLDFAVDLYIDCASSITVPGYNPPARENHTDYPGGHAWRDYLINQEVNEGDIFLTSGEMRVQHTRSEGDEFIECARKEGWRSALILANPHQILRAMLGLVKTLKIFNYHMCLYPAAPPRVAWRKEVYGSKGQRRLRRHEHINEEWARIQRYQAQGDLASLAELRDYLLSL